MRVSTKSDYALRALIEIAVAQQDGPISADELGRRQEIPRGFLQAILADLRRSEIVISQRGQSGGWLLARPAEGITIADVIRSVDGPLVSIYDQRPEAVEYNHNAESLQQVWIAARYALRDVLENVTIEQLARRSLPGEVMRRVADEDAWRPH